VRDSEAGFSLVAAAAGITVMMVMMGVAVPSWRYVMQNAREEELLFRGGQIADAIQRYQAKHGNTPPVSLEVLVKGKFLRKAYKDPMTEKGQWRFIRPGEVLVQPPPGAGGRQPGAMPGQAQPTPSPETRPGLGSSSRPGQSMGPFIGVASTSKEKSLRVFNQRSRYDQWLFVVGQPRVVGKDANNMPRLPGMKPPRPGQVNPSPLR
jgi:type II secretory pathway pseudopilin PulG